jgi:hypothetical protein
MRWRVPGVQPHQTVHEHMHERDDEPEFLGAASPREPVAARVCAGPDFAIGGVGREGD